MTLWLVYTGDIMETVWAAVLPAHCWVLTVIWFHSHQRSFNVNIKSWLSPVMTLGKAQWPMPFSKELPAPKGNRHTSVRSQKTGEEPWKDSGITTHRQGSQTEATVPWRRWRCPHLRWANERGQSHSQILAAVPLVWGHTLCPAQHPGSFHILKMKIIQQ